MATHTTLNSLFTDIADQIRVKLGTSDPILADNFPEAISNIVISPAVTSIYKLYDINQNEIPYSNWTITGLADAYYYTKNSGAMHRVGGRIFYINSNIAEGSADKFYVYDNTTGLHANLKWSNDITTGAGCTSNTFGSGKQNSAIAIDLYSNVNDSIWNYCKYTMNANSVGGCNDWYIGSAVENDLLRCSGLVDWFTNNSILSAVEYLLDSASSVLIWNYNCGYWIDNYKSSSNSCFYIRSF